MRKLFGAIFAFIVLFFSLDTFAQQVTVPEPDENVNPRKQGRERRFNVYENDKEPCMYDQLLEKRMEDPAYREMMARFEEEIRRRSEEIRRNTRPGQKAEVYTIPVVFHVLHVGEPVGSGHNIPEDQIRSSITGMNRDFRRLATDGGVAQGVGSVDVEVEFCLATVDPDGNPTNGINRVNANGVANYQNVGIDEDVNGSQLKALSKWPTADYVNVWVVREINNQGEFGEWNGGVLGYAYPVSTSPNENPNANPSFNPGDGIVVVNFSLGNDPDGSENWNIYPFLDLNRTMTHEMGHHLNLQHTFKGGTCNESDCTTEGDFVCDTPPTPQQTNCNTPACGGTQQVGNYMDYTGEACADMFSAGQKTRMRAVLEGFSRNSLTTSVGCAVGFVEADFIVDQDTILEGETVNFTDESIGNPAITSWNWDFGDGGTSTQENPSHTYNTEGVYEVRLTVDNGNQTDTKIRTDYIYVDVANVATGTIGGPCSNLRNFTYAEAENFGTYVAQGTSDPIPGVGGSSNTGFAERFQNTGSFTFQDVILDVESANDAGAPTTFEFKVYGLAGNNPGAVLATKTVAIADFTAGQENTVSFDSPVTVNGDFFVGWEYTNTSDFFRIYATELRNGGSGYSSLYGRTTGWFPYNAGLSSAIQVVPSTGIEADIIESNNTSLDFCLDGSLTFELANAANVTDYSWNFGPDATPSTSTAANPTVTFASQGQKSISVNVTGACGASATDQITAFGYEAPDISAQITDADCEQSNGSVVLTHAGNETMSYNWVGQSNTTNTLSNVAPGDYQVEVTNGPCSFTETYTVGENAPAPATGTFTVEDATCGKNNGSIEVAMSRSGTFEYFWDGSNTATGNSLDDIVAGTYEVIVKENGCTVYTGSATVEDEVESFDLTPQITDSDCGQNNGSITVTNNGSPDVTYNWDGQNNTTNQISDLAPGTYILEVQNGTCVNEFEYTVGENPPNPATGTFYTEAEVCGKSNGLVAVTMSRAGSFEFFWNQSATPQNDTLYDVESGLYTLEVVENNCVVFTGEVTVASETEAFDITADITKADCGLENGSVVLTNNGNPDLTYSWNGQNNTTNTLSNVASGSYTVTLTNGACVEEQTFNVGENTPEVAGEFYVEDATCGKPNGTVAITMAQAGNYEYFWNGAATPENDTLTEQLAANYAVTVRENGCVVFVGDTNIQDVAVPFDFDTVLTHPTCGNSDGQIVIVNNGSADVTLSWTGQGSSNDTLAALPAGSYELVLSNGTCDSTISIVLAEPAIPATGSFYVEHPTCADSNGVVAITLDRQGSFEYFWNGADTSNADTLFNRKAELQSVVVREDGCVIFSGDTLLVNEGEIPQVSVEVTDADCNEANGKLVATVDSEDPVTYNWVGQNNTTDTLDGVPAGTYTLEVSNGACTFVDSFVVAGATDPVAYSLVVSHPTCERASGSIRIDMEQGQNVDYDFFWNEEPASKDSMRFNLAEGDYSIDIFLNGCLVAAIDTVLADTTFMPTAGFTFSPNPIVENEPVTFYANEAGLAEHYWHFEPGGIHLQGDTVTVTFTDEGVYDLQLQASSYCADTLFTEVEVDNNVSIAEWASVPVSLHPNPVNDQLNVVFGSTVTVEQVFVTDVVGRMVVVPTQIAPESIALDVTELAAGHYQFVVVTQQGSATARFVVKH